MRLWEPTVLAVSFWVTAGCIGSAPSGVAEYDEVAPADDDVEPFGVDPAAIEDDRLFGGDDGVVAPAPPDAGDDDDDATPPVEPDDAIETEPGPGVVGCRDGSAEQFFGESMRGCGGTWRFEERSYACEPGWHVCSADEWVERAHQVAPGFHYWTDDVLQFAGYDHGECVVMPAPETGVETACPGMPSATGSPMRVCASDGVDVYGNECALAGCGLGGRPEAEFFGGCGRTETASALCCL